MKTMIERVDGGARDPKDVIAIRVVQCHAATIFHDRVGRASPKKKPGMWCSTMERATRTLSVSSLPASSPEASEVAASVATVTMKDPYGSRNHPTSGGVDVMVVHTEQCINEGCSSGLTHPGDPH